MLRMEDTDEDGDLRPRRPVLDRRKVDRGVNGDGEREWRLLLGVVYIRAIGGCDWFAGGKAGLAAGGVLEVAGRGLGSFPPALELFVDFWSRSGVDLVILFPGDLARFAESSSQCFQLASWFIKAC